MTAVKKPKTSRKDAKNAKEIHKMVNFIDPGWLYCLEK
jgi:hypothetical protein